MTDEEREKELWDSYWRAVISIPPHLIPEARRILQAELGQAERTHEDNLQKHGL